LQLVYYLPTKEKEEYFICSLLVELIWFIVVFVFFVFRISINLGVAGME